MKILAIVAIFLGASLTSYSTTYYTTGAGDFGTSAIWGTDTNGTGGTLGSLTLVSGDTLYIDDDVTIDNNVTIDVDVVIIVDATLSISKRIDLTANSRIEVTDNGSIVPIGGGDSPKIIFGNGQSQWSGSDGDLSGPGFLDENSDGTLPVELVYFKVINESPVVNLNWVTASEENFDRFEIQRAAGSADFRTLGVVYGSEQDSYELRNYQFSDESPVNGINYYRLKSIDLDGTFEYSDLQVVMVDNPELIKIYPNPVSTGVLSILMNDAEDKQVIIRNSSGKIVFKDTLAVDLQTLDISSLRPGMYVITVFGAFSKKSQNLIVQ